MHSRDYEHIDLERQLILFKQCAKKGCAFHHGRTTSRAEEFSFTFIARIHEVGKLILYPHMQGSQTTRRVITREISAKRVFNFTAGFVFAIFAVSPQLQLCTFRMAYAGRLVRVASLQNNSMCYLVLQYTITYAP